MLGQITFQPADVMGLFVGLMFGISLYVSGLANPDKIIGTLRLKDFHAFRVIAVFLIVGMLGVWAMDMGGLSPYSPKTAQLLVNAIGGALLGIGFGMTGYCPGTGLACAAAGRIDALITVIGMLGGAAFYIWVYPHVVPQMQAIGDYGEARLPEITNTDPTWWVLPICGVGLAALFLTRPKPEKLGAPGSDHAPNDTQEPAEDRRQRFVEDQPRDADAGPISLNDEDDRNEEPRP